ncbi:outer membrane lipoprotein-sorting protein [bacterium]|nr:outer membrane lipoprotein-sorting protein [bacterium]
MTKKISRVKIALLMVFLSLTLGVNQGFAAEWSSIHKKLKAKYASFEKEVKDMTIVQEMQIHRGKKPVISKNKIYSKGKKSRVETSIPTPSNAENPGGKKQMKTIFISDGRNEWVISPFMGKKKLSPKEQKNYQTGANWYDQLPTKAKITGTEKIGKHNCYVVEFKPTDSFSFTKIWLEKKNLLLIKALGQGEKERVLSIINSDFKKIKGMWETPYKTQMYSGKQLSSTLLTRSLKINKGLSDDLFDPDKVETKGSAMPAGMPNMQEMMQQMMQQKK